MRQMYGELLCAWSSAAFFFIEFTWCAFIPQDPQAPVSDWSEVSDKIKPVGKQQAEEALVLAINYVPTAIRRLHFC